MNKQAIDSALEYQRSKMTKAWRYDDWILGLRQDGYYFKLPHGSPVIAIVCLGKLPNADKLITGYITWL